jgi:hypothetical protein
MSKKLKEPRVVRDADQIHWLIVRHDGERIGGFKSEAEAWRYVERGHDLRPIKKDIKTYVEGVEIPTPPPPKDGGES